MSAVDTSAEAVDADVAVLETMVTVSDYPGPIMANAMANRLRALAAERDALQQDVDALRPLSLRCDRLAAEVEKMRAEVAALRLTLGGKTFDATVPEPIGCPMPGACSTVAEIVRGREATAAWLRVIQAENTCGVTGKPCDAVRCGCAAEQEMLIREAADAASEPDA